MMQVLTRSPETCKSTACSSSSTVGDMRDAATEKIPGKRFVSKKAQVVLKPLPFKPIPIYGNGGSTLHGDTSESIVNQVGSVLTQDNSVFINKYVETFGKGCLHRALWKAAYKGDENIMCALLRSGKGDPSWRNPDYYNYTALHAASQKGHFLCVKELLHHGASVDAVGNGGETPLHEACHEKHQLCALLLLDNGANLSSETKYKKTAFDFCTANHFTQALQQSFVAHQNHEQVTAQLRTALATNIIERSVENVARASDRSALVEALAAKDLLQKANQEKEEKIARLTRDLLKSNLEKQERTSFLEEQVRIEDSKRRAVQRQAGDLKFELDGVKAQLDECKKALLASYSENDQLDKYIESSVSAVALKNKRRYANRLRLESPRTVKLDTLNKRVHNAEEHAYNVTVQKESAEREGAAVKRRLLRVEKELFQVRSEQRRQKYSAIKIQRLYRRRLNHKAKVDAARITLATNLVHGAIATAVGKLRETNSTTVNNMKR